jgi:hypothetical protein
MLWSICIGNSLIWAIFWYLKFSYPNSSFNVIAIPNLAAYSMAAWWHHYVPVGCYSAVCYFGVRVPSCYSSSPRCCFLFCLVSRDYMTSGSYYWCVVFLIVYSIKNSLSSDLEVSGLAVQYTLPAMLSKQFLTCSPFNKFLAMQQFCIAVAV